MQEKDILEIAIFEAKDLINPNFKYPKPLFLEGIDRVQSSTLMMISTDVTNLCKFFISSSVEFH